MQGESQAWISPTSWNLTKTAKHPKALYVRAAEQEKLCTAVLFVFLQSFSQHCWHFLGPVCISLSRHARYCSFFESCSNAFLCVVHKDSAFVVPNKIVALSQGCFVAQQNRTTNTATPSMRHPHLLWLASSRSRLFGCLPTYAHRWSFNIKGCWECTPSCAWTLSCSL